MHFLLKIDKNNCQYYEHYRAIPEHYRVIIWEFENSIIGKHFSIIYKSLIIYHHYIEISPCVCVCVMEAGRLRVELDH